MQVARQLTRVLRARSGDEIVVLDNSGWEYVVQLERVESKHADGRVKERRRSSGEPSLEVALYQAVLKESKFDFVLQKGTELGVSSFVPVYCARSVPRPRGRSKADRWERVVAEAAEQSRRGRLPSIGEPVDFEEACKKVEGPAVIPWEEEASQSLRDVLDRLGKPMARLSVLTGPEGGFSEDEVGLARSLGIEPVTLGGRILRAETAPLAVVSAVMYSTGELGG